MRAEHIRVDLALGLALNLAKNRPGVLVMVPEQAAD